MKVPSLNGDSRGPVITSRRLQRVNTVASTIAILRKLSETTRPLGVNALARALDLTPSSCFNIIKTLVEEDMVDFDPETKFYSIGTGFISMVRGALDPERAFDTIKPRLEDLLQKWPVTLGLWRLQNDRIVLMGYLAGARTMRIQMVVGQRLPHLIGAIGRCIAGSLRLSKKELASQFTRLKWESAPSLDQYLAEVRQAEEFGWSIDRDHFVKGVTSVGVPFPRHDGKIQYCISATTFSGQYNDADLAVLASEIQRTVCCATKCIDAMGVDTPPEKGTRLICAS